MNIIDVISGFGYAVREIPKVVEKVDSTIRSTAKAVDGIIEELAKELEMALQEKINTIKHVTHTTHSDDSIFRHALIAEEAAAVGAKKNLS